MGFIQGRDRQPTNRQFRRSVLSLDPDIPFIEGALTRLRPVLMTAFSMILGVLPAALGVGPGSESRQPMAVATAAGMFSSTLLTLLVVPVLYIVLDDLSEWVRKRGRRRPRELSTGAREALS